MITSGYELTTAITNVFIFLVSLFCYIKVNNKPWKNFFLFMCIDSFLGVIAHGIVMNKIVNDFLWIIISVLFTITINLFLNIILNIKMKHIILLSTTLSLIMLSQLFLNMNFLLTFTIYVLLIIIISVYYVIKKNLKNKYYILLGFLFQIIGGILLLCRVKIGLFNYNGIYHLFTTISLIPFYLGAQKKD